MNKARGFCPFKDTTQKVVITAKRSMAIGCMATMLGPDTIEDLGVYTITELCGEEK